MGGGFACNNYLEKCCQNQPETKKISLEYGENRIPKNTLKNNLNYKIYNKRFSDYHSNNLRYSNFIRNKMKNTNEAAPPDASFTGTSYINNPNNNNNENINANNKLILSQLNSSNLNESTFPSNINNNPNAIHDSNKYNNRKKILKDKNKDMSKKRSETLINYNMGENNFIFINISRGSTFINNNDLEKIESVTPKLMMGKENLENINNGNKQLFSHFLNKRRENCNYSNQKCNCDIASSFAPFLDMEKYNEEMLNIINSIRTNPESFIKDIDYIINNNIKQTEEGIFLISHEVDEKIKLMENYMEIFNKTKIYLKNMANSQEKKSKLKNIIYNDNLELILDESSILEADESEIEVTEEEDDIKNIPKKLNSIYDDDIIDYGIEEEEIKSGNNLDVIDFESDDEKEESPNNKKKIKENKKIKNIKNNNISNRHVNFKKKKSGKKKRNINTYLNLEDDQIANLILKKRKEVLFAFPQNIFKLSVIKDIKISILIELSMEELFRGPSKTSLKEIIFNPVYKYFALSWTNEINRNFISISCFA
jgi:hypothetical protein